jgi:DNA-binding NarL/FixJ family response regulator
MTAKIRTVIADDHYLVRDGTRRILESSGTVDVVAAVADADELLDATERLAPDAAIVDIRMPPHHHTEGIDAALTIRTRHPDVGVIVLSQHVSPLYAFALFRNGTDRLAYLLKDRVGDRDELVAALVTVTSGGSVIDPVVVDALLARGRSNVDAIGSLTERELEILAHMAQGKSNQAIVDSIHLSTSSVEKHINMIFTKLGLDRSDTTINRRVAAVLTLVQDQDR